MNQHLFQSAENWPVYGTYDVVVIGAGPGGFGAAISAARQGLRVILVERYGFPGGVSTLSSCPVFLGFTHDNRQITGGLADELVRALDQFGAASFILEDPPFIAEYLPVGDQKLTRNIISSTEAVRIVINRMLEQAGVERLFYATLIGAQMQGETLCAAAVMCAQGACLIKGRCFVDATGDANLVYYAGGQVREANVEDSMAKSLFFDVCGVTLFDKRENQRIYDALYQAGKVPDGLLDKFSICSRLEPGVVNICLGMTAGNALDSADLTRMDMELREQIPVIVDFLQREMPGFKNCAVISSSIHIGIRAGRSIVGLQTVTPEWIDSAPPVDEPVAVIRRTYGAHSINKQFHPKWRKVNPGVTAVPLKTLIPRSFTNVAAAGRAISFEPRAIDTIRMMPCCMTTGQAAGSLAALAVKNKLTIPEVGYDQVRQLLSSQGVILA